MYLRVYLYITVCVAGGVAKLRARRAAGRQPELTTEWVPVKQVEVSRLRGDSWIRWKLWKQLIRLVRLIRFGTRHGRVSFPGAHAITVTVMNDNAHSTASKTRLKNETGIMRSIVSSTRKGSFVRRSCEGLPIVRPAHGLLVVPRSCPRSHSGRAEATPV